jgi:hypothetical protein
MNRGTELSGARVRVVHPSAIVISGTSTESGSPGADCTSAATNSASLRRASAVPTPALAGCPASVNQGNRCDAN